MNKYLVITILIVLTLLFIFMLFINLRRKSSPTESTLSYTRTSSQDVSSAAPLDAIKKLPTYSKNKLVKQDAELSSVTYETTDSPQAIMAWYKSNLEKAGWKVTVNPQDQDDIATLAFSKDDTNGQVTVVRDGDKSFITIFFGDTL